MLFCGIAGIFFSWNEKKRMRIKRMEDVCRFVSHAAYLLETEKPPAAALFQASCHGDEPLCELLFALCAKMQSHNYPSAEALWNSVWMPYMEAWHFSGEFRELVRGCANGFFGLHLKENIALLRAAQIQMQEMITREKADFAEKKKIAAPVSLLGGIMAVIILW